MITSRCCTFGQVCALSLLLATVTTGAAGAGQVELVSHVDPGAPSDTASGFGPDEFTLPAISRDGRYVAFLSPANNLVPGQIDRNANGGGQESNDVFLYDRVARTTVLVSHDAAAVATGGNGESGAPAISADGRWVVFASQAANLADGLPEDPHGQSRIFLYDRVTEAVTLVSSSEALEASGGGGNGFGAAQPGDQRRRPLHRLRQQRARPRPRPAGRQPGGQRLPLRPHVADDRPRQPRRHADHDGRGH